MRMKWKKVGVVSVIVLLLTLLLIFFIGYIKEVSFLPQEAMAEQEVLKIGSLEDYFSFAKTVSKGEMYVNQTIRLSTDLDFSGVEDLKMIGEAEEGNVRFMGTFDGDGHKIYGIKMKDPQKNVGMFADLGGIVKNLILEDCEFEGVIAGAIAPVSYNGNVLNCCLEAEVLGETAGAAIGRLHGNIFNCVASMEEVTGEIQRGVVENCYVRGAEDVTALNANLVHISGYYNDTRFYQWELTGQSIFHKKTADLLSSLSTRLMVAGREFKLNGYYSANDKCWCIALPASFREAELVLEARTTDGGYECFQRMSGEEEMLFTWAENLYPIRLLSADQAETFYVTLEGQKTLSAVHEDKYQKYPGILTVFYTDGSLKDYEIKGFYGHGNDSWSAPKKSYNLKMMEKTDLLGMGEDEDFTLLAGYRDDSLMNYCTTTELIRELGFPYAPDERLVNLYVAGDYVGVYFLAEKVELDENRIDIASVYEETKKLNHENLKKGQIQEWKDENSFAERYYYEIENNPTDLTGGYLLEADICDYEADESRFVSTRGLPFTLKRAKYSSKEQVEYISGYWQKFEDALFSEDGKNTEGKHYTDYIDLESFAMQWLLYELVQEGSMSSSIYFYKESDLSGDGLLHACFPWDMEHSYVLSEKVFELWNTGEKAGTLYGYWSILYTHQDFREELQRVWNEKFVPAITQMLKERPEITENGMKNLSWYEAWIPELSALEGSRWRKMNPLNRCRTNREFLEIRCNTLSEKLARGGEIEQEN